MNDPIPPELEALLRAERTVPPELAARRTRVLARLDASLLALTAGAAVHAGTAGTVPVGTAHGVASRLGSLVRSKLTIVGVALTVGAGSGAAVGFRAGERAAETRQAQVARVPSPTTDVQATARASVAPSTSTVTPASPLGSLPDARSAVAPRSTPTASLQTEASERDEAYTKEVALIQMARTALARGDHAGALEATDAHHHRFPRGRMVEDRESIAIQALASAHRTDEARARAEQFKAKYPHSILLPTVDVARKSIP